MYSYLFYHFLDFFQTFLWILNNFRSIDIYEKNIHLYFSDISNKSLKSKYWYIRDYRYFHHWLHLCSEPLSLPLPYNHLLPKVKYLEEYALHRAVQYLAYIWSASKWDSIGCWILEVECESSLRTMSCLLVITIMIMIIQIFKKTQVSELRFHQTSELCFRVYFQWFYPIFECL